ncbi:MAG TPA: ABC transporter substrate-binding protein, partial [Planctomycetaceae bacterium]
MASFSSRSLSRRTWLGLTAGTLALAACQAGPAPTAAPAKTGAATPPPAAKPTAAAAAKPAEAPKPTAAPAKPATLDKFKFGIISAQFATIFEMIGVDKGLYRDEGIDVDLIQVDNNPTLEKGLLAGEFDAIDVTPLGVLAAAAQGGKYKLVGSPKPGLPLVLFVKKDINSLKEIVDNGRTIGISAPGDITYATISAAMEKDGVDANKATWVPLGGSIFAVFQAVMAGKVDAAAALIDSIPVAESNQDIKILFDFSEKLPDYVRVTTITSDQVIASKPDVLTRFLTGYAKSIRYAIQHKDESVALATKLTGGDAKLQDW